MRTFTKTLATAMLLLTPSFTNAQKPVHREHYGYLGSGVTVGTSVDRDCNGMVIRNFYIARPQIFHGQIKACLEDAACHTQQTAHRIYEGGRKAVATTGAAIEIVAKRTTCAVGKAVEGVGTAEHYIGTQTQRAGQYIQRAGCDAGCYGGNLDPRCP